MIFQISITSQDETTCFPCRHDQTVLEAAEENEIDLIHSCGIGMCGECAYRISDGKYLLGDGNIAGETFSENGLILTCVTYPRSDLKLVPAEEGSIEVYQPRRSGT